MKKASVIILSLMLILALSGCGSSKEKSSTDSKPLSADEIEELFTSPNEFKGRTATLVGEVFDVEKKDGKIAFQIWHDIENVDKNAIVYYEDKKLALKEGDFVKITGKVEGEFKGENAFGAEVTAPKIKASKVEVSDYMTIVDPALKTVEPNKTIEQSGVSITIEKVEFTAKETRVYTKITNNSGAAFSFYSYSGKLLQGGQQFETGLGSFEADYPEIASDLLPGVSSSGIMVFPAIQQSSFQVHLEGSSDNYDIDIEPFVFDIEVN